MPGSVTPLLTRRAPMTTTSVSPTFRKKVMMGPGKDMMMLAFSSSWVSCSLETANRVVSCASLDRAFTTRMPVMFSRMMRTTPSRLRCTRS